jgi:crotonobetainyl-CoA:carnitine CoA-transferase CaiB-like acyl-CoA transferase
MKTFSDLIIIDASTVLAGPSVGTFFAELGATVIKVENSNSIDVTRSWKLPMENRESIISAYFSSVNYGKKYMQLNLMEEKDHASFIELVKVADILICNYKKGDQEKLKITDELLQSVNPQLIIGKINGFGTESDRVAYDLILQAETGYMSMNGTPESGPVKMPVALIDVLAGHQLKEALLISLLERKKDIRGKIVSVSLYDAAVSSLVNQASNYLMYDQIPQRIGSLHPNIAPYGEIFQTKDGDSITFAIGSNLHFEKLCRFLGLEELIQHANFYSNQMRVIHRKQLAELLQSKISTKETHHILGEMIEQNVPVGKIKDLEEVFQHEKALALIRSEEMGTTLTHRVSSIAFKWKQ